MRSASRIYWGDSDPDYIQARTVMEETRLELRPRVLNPKWLESMKKHGYKGEEILRSL